MNARLREELQKYLIVSAYLYVCFGALLLFEAALLSGSGVHPLTIGTAAGKALILGKFLLIGDAVHVGARGHTRNMLQRIVRRSVLLLILLVLLTIVEEIVLGLVHGHSLAQTLAGFGSEALPQKLATGLLMLLVLVPLVTVGEINRALGPGRLHALVFGATSDQPIHHDQRPRPPG
jgi:hypothetical protein